MKSEVGLVTQGPHGAGRLDSCIPSVCQASASAKALRCAEFFAFDHWRALCGTRHGPTAIRVPLLPTVPT